MNILPHQGFGNIVLGTSRLDVLAHLGQPDERSEVNYSDDSCVEYFEYSSPDLTLGFDSDDGDRLGTITVRCDDAVYNGYRVIGRLVEDLLSDIPALVLDDDFEESGMDYVHPSHDLSFWVSEGRVINVTIFPSWIDHDTPRWPPQNTSSEQDVDPNA